MHTRRQPACQVFVIVGLLARPALAAVETTTVENDRDATQAAQARQVVLEGQLGTNTPLGPYGLAVDVQLARLLAVSAGIGSGIVVKPGSEEGVTTWLSLMPRLRVAPW